MGELEPPRWLFLGRPKIKEQCWDPGSFPKAFLEPWGTLETSGVESGEPQESVDPSWRFGEGRMRRGALKKAALCVVFVRCWFGLSVLGGFFPHLEFSAPRFESVPPFLSLPAATPSRWKKGQFPIPNSQWDFWSHDRQIPLPNAAEPHIPGDCSEQGLSCERRSPLGAAALPSHGREIPHFPGSQARGEWAGAEFA